MKLKSIKIFLINFKTEEICILKVERLQASYFFLLITFKI